MSPQRYGQCNFSYLIVGSQRVLLFDTGLGLRHNRKVVATLTALPILALLNLILQALMNGKLG
jgi:hypothetical protein